LTHVYPYEFQTDINQINHNLGTLTEPHNPNIREHTLRQFTPFFTYLTLIVTYIQPAKPYMNSSQTQQDFYACI